MCSRHSTMYWGERHKLNKLLAGATAVLVSHFRIRIRTYESFYFNGRKQSWYVTS